MKPLLYLIILCSTIAFSQKEIAHNVYFNTDKYDIPLTEENRLLLFISTIDTLPIEKISIYGFTDDRGTNDYNSVLSQNRANTIKELFEGYGIAPHLITNVNGKGEILLKILTEEEVHKIRGLNRKVEISVALQEPEPEPIKDITETPREKITEVSKIVSNTKPKLKTTDDLFTTKLVVGDKIRLDKVYFKTGYSSITKESRPALEKVAKLLIENPNICFSIQGHVCCTKLTRDAVDKKTGKRNLSMSRAKYIYDFLSKKGIDPKRMKYAGLRRRFPLGGDPKADRRVEIVITKILP